MKDIAESTERFPIDKVLYDLYFKALRRDDLSAHQKHFLEAFKKNIDDLETKDVSHKQFIALQKVAEGEIQ